MFSKLSQTNEKPNQQRVLCRDFQRIVLMENQINNIKEQIRRHNHFEFVPSNMRHVLFLGRTRSGKTTTINVLKDPCHQPKQISIFAETKDPKVQTFSIQDNQVIYQELQPNSTTKRAVVEYTISTIDTPGLFENHDINEKQQKRTEEEIVKTIRKCLEFEITKLNCVVLFASFEVGLVQQDVDAIKTFCELFGKRRTDARPVPQFKKNEETGLLERVEDQVNKETNEAAKEVNEETKEATKGLTLALCITHAERKDENWKNNIISQLWRQEELSDILRHFDIKILFMGCIDPLEYSNEDDLFQGYSKVFYLREDLMQMIIDADYQEPLLSLNVIKHKVDEFAKSLNALTLSSSSLAATTPDNWGLALTQQRISEHKRLLQKIEEETPGYQMAPELTKEFLKLMQALKSLSNRTDIEQKEKRELLGIFLRE